MDLIKKVAVVILILVVAISAYYYFKISSNLTRKEDACFEALAQKFNAGTSPEVLFQQELENLQFLVEASLVARSQMLEVSGRLKQNREAPLASRDLVILKSGTEAYLEVREQLWDIANSYECAAGASQETLSKHHIDSKLRLKGLMLSLGAALTLYDNYLIGTLMFEKDSRLRRVINDPDMGFGLVSNKLKEMTLAANSIENRHRIRRAITFYEKEKPTIENAEEDSDFSYLMYLIETSPSYNYVKGIRIKDVASNKLDAVETILEDLAADATQETFDKVSGLFGNTIGLYESRKGKLYNNEIAKQKIQATLQPLDILLEKTPFRLTDKLIPGHFGHVAIWTGTETELIKDGVWDNPIVSQYAKLVNGSGDPNSKDEHQIIEALRNGVQLSTLDHFLNIDDFAILRPLFDEKDKKALTKEALIMAFRQVGKEYDFNFDVNTTDKIVCSELAYVSFPSVDWPTQKTLGRYNISPDNVAQLAWNNVPLKLILFYHDGQLVDESVQLETMKTLMTR